LIQLDGVEFRTNLREGSGVFASKDLKQGELIFTIPEDIMMTQMSAVASTKDCSVLISASSLVRDLPSLQLALHLLFEKVSRDRCRMEQLVERKSSLWLSFLPTASAGPSNMNELAASDSLITEGFNLFSLRR
jgi:hypothetical protein